MYFKSPENGTFRRVPQRANGRLNRTYLEQDGGLTVYYMQPFSGSNLKTTAFKPVRDLVSPLACALTVIRDSECLPETQVSAPRLVWQQESAIDALLKARR